jgi:hypothetical protein
VPLRKFVLTGSAAILGLAVVGIPAIALADDSPGGSPPSVSQPGNLSATVSQSPSGVFSVTLPDFGSLTFQVDPPTGTITGLMVTADPGVTAGAPVLRNEGVEVPFSGSATTERLEVEVESENVVPRVTAKAEGERNQGGANRDDRRDDHGDENDADDTPVQPGAIDELHGDGDHGDHGDHDANGDHDADGDRDANGEPPPTTTTTTTTTTTLPSAPASNRSPGGPPPQSNNQSRGPGSETSGSNSGSSGSDNSGSDNSGSDNSGEDGSGQGGSGHDSSGPGGSGQDGSGSGN